MIDKIPKFPDILIKVKKIFYEYCIDKILEKIGLDVEEFKSIKAAFCIPGDNDDVNIIQFLLYIKSSVNAALDAMLTRQKDITPHIY